MSNPFLFTLGRSSFRALYSILGGVALATWGMSRGWPWWVAVPAGILTTAAVFIILLTALYTYTKLHYPARAEAIRARTNRRPAEGRPPGVQPTSAVDTDPQMHCQQDRPPIAGGPGGITSLRRKDE
ncbi:MAG: hypothetical protein N2512_01400 [Armatimonadetes bacterium]|nr:hypothetical protein [Armatimonadota bacterium]